MNIFVNNFSFYFIIYNLMQNTSWIFYLNSVQHQQSGFKKLGLAADYEPI